MKLGVPREIAAGETRVAATPETVRRYVGKGLEVLVEASAGERSSIRDEEFRSAGAQVVADAAAVLGRADMVVKINAPTTDDLLGRNELAMFKAGQVLVAPFLPLVNHELVRKLAAAGVTSLSLDMIPRTTRAQAMDVLSSMSTLAGYKAVLLAADNLPRMCPLMMTAAGTLRPATALVIGAGVAGLQAIATAKRIGAVVTAIDVRPAVREQVESLGAKYVSMEVHHEAETAAGYARDLGEEFYRAEQEIIAPHARGADMIVATAMVPGRPAPVLITEKMVREMKPGTVIVDLAASAGGNCGLTQPGKTVEHHGVRIIGAVNLPATLPVHASQMFARNVAAFLGELIDERGQLNMDVANEVVRSSLITQQGRIVHEAVRQACGAEAQQ